MHIYYNSFCIKAIKNFDGGGIVRFYTEELLTAFR